MKQVTNKVIYRPISELCEWEDNPRAITEEGIEHLMKSIERDPLYIEARPLLLSDRTGKLVVIGGNQRMKACTRLGWREVPTVLFSGLTEEEEYEKATIDNTHDGVWDADKLREACEKWGASKLESWGITELPTFDEIEDDNENFGDDIDVNSEQCDVLSDCENRDDISVFCPFSILDTRRKIWVDRKTHWRNIIGFDTESRDNLCFKLESRYPKLYKKFEKDRYVYKCSFNEYVEIKKDEINESKIIQNGTSIFDPVVSELMSSWFTPHKNSLIIDPFAGDVNKGAVFAKCGHRFIGIELRKEQVDVNNTKCKELSVIDSVSYICDDAINIHNHIEPESSDMIFSCPPYFNLEKYSDLENDASNQSSYDDFIKIIDTAFTDSIKCLKTNRFAVIVVGDIRNRKDGCYYDFCGDIKRIFTKSGMKLYNELIVVENSGSAGMRMNRNMETRKITKTHQNVLVFYKGDTKKIKSEFVKLKF